MLRLVWTARQPLPSKQSSRSPIRPGSLTRILIAAFESSVPAPRSRPFTHGVRKEVCRQGRTETSPRREGFQNLGSRSCCGSVVLVYEAAESVAALDLAGGRWIGRVDPLGWLEREDRKSTRLNSSHQIQLVCRL